MADDIYKQCEETHIAELRAYLKEHSISIFSEHEEDGWVNVWCKKCQAVHEITLRLPT